MQRQIFPLVLGFGAVAFAGAEDTLRAPYWPLQCEPAATSMFCDYRPGHLHSGTDLKTWGAVGVPVVSEGEGYIFRVGVGTSGYGKVVYLRLDNGEYRVFAHLSGFMAEVAARVRKEQYANKNYTVQLYFEKDQIRVKKGQVIAFSGATGVGVPHLHFEHRSADNIPLNALRRGLKVKDGHPPVITKLALKPMGPGSTVAGKEAPLVLPLVSRGGTFVADSSVQAFGALGLTVEAYDVADGADNRFGVYRNELYLDDSLIFAGAYDSMDFEVTRQVHLDRDLGLLRGGFGTFQALYVESGNRLGFYSPFKAGDGIIAPRHPGPHRIRVRCQDAAGNVSSAELMFRYFNPPVVRRIEILPDSGGPVLLAEAERGTYGAPKVKISFSPDGKSWKNFSGSASISGNLFRFQPGPLPPGGFFVRALATDSMGNASRPLYASGGGAGDPAASLELVPAGESVAALLKVSVPLYRTPELFATVNGERRPFAAPRSETPGEYRWPFDSLPPGESRITLSATLTGSNGPQLLANKNAVLCAVEPGRPARVTSDDGHGALNLPASTVLHRACLMLEPYPDSLCTAPWPELTYVGPAYRISPAIVYYDKNVGVEISIPRREKTGIFTSMGEMGWRFLSAKYTEAGRYAGEIRENIPFALFQDTIPPAVSLQDSFRSGDTLTAPHLVFRLSDKGSGISSDKNISTEIDGAWRLNEYDPEEGTAEVPLDGIGPGTHRFSITVRDNLNNENRLALTFYRP